MAGQGGCNFNEEYKKINGCGMKHFNIRAAIASLFSGSGRNNRNGLPEKTDFSDEDARYMRMAIDLSVENMEAVLLALSLFVTERSLLRE